MGSRCPPQKCQVCCEAQSKYKCPNCFAPYCSLTCFKKHKEIPCKKSLPLVDEPTNPALAKRSYEVDDRSWVVDKGHLLLIANSSEIQEALKDVDLRRTIQNIVGSNDMDKQLTEAMKGQVFRDFSDKILSIVSPQE